MLTAKYLLFLPCSSGRGVENRETVKDSMRAIALFLVAVLIDIMDKNVLCLLADEGLC